MTFSRDEESRHLVHVAVAVDVIVTCQRCLEAFRLPLEVEDRLLLLGLEETVDGYDEYEVWELEEALLRPQDLVEELLIMAEGEILAVVT